MAFRVAPTWRMSTTLGSSPKKTAATTPPASTTLKTSLRRLTPAWCHVHIGRLPRNGAPGETCAMVGRLRTYMAVVSAIGFVVLCLLAANIDFGQVRDELPRVALLSAFVLAATFLTIPLSRDASGPRVMVDSPFVFALVLVGGPGVAALVMAVSLTV